MSLVGLSYNEFVGYCMAAMEEGMMVVERVVVCGSRVCMEEKDVKEGLFLVTNLDEAANVLVPRTPERLRELVGYTFFKPPPLGWLASCFLLDFIEVRMFVLSQESFFCVYVVNCSLKLTKPKTHILMPQSEKLSMFYFFY